MEMEIRSFKAMLDATVDVSVVIIMSHGTNSNIPGGHTEILCSDHNLYRIENVLDHFTSDSCPNMTNKPKIFIFQCCR